MNETRIMGSGAHGERPQAPRAEKGVLHEPSDGRTLIVGPEEAEVFRAQLAQVRSKATTRLDMAQSAYTNPSPNRMTVPRRGESAPIVSPQAVDVALQRKFDQDHVIIPGTPEGDRARHLRNQRYAQPTQQTGGVFDRVRSWFR